MRANGAEHGKMGGFEHEYLDVSGYLDRAVCGEVFLGEQGRCAGV